MTSPSLLTAQRSIIEKIYSLTKLLYWMNKTVKAPQGSKRQASKNTTKILALHKAVNALKDGLMGHSGLHKRLAPSIPRHLSSDHTAKLEFEAIKKLSSKSKEDFMGQLKRFFEISMRNIKKKNPQDLQAISINEFKNKALVLLAYYKLNETFPNNNTSDEAKRRVEKFGSSSPRAFYAKMTNVQHNYITEDTLTRALEYLNLSMDDIDNHYKPSESCTDTDDKSQALEQCQKDALDFIDSLIDTKNLL